MRSLRAGTARLLATLALAVLLFGCTAAPTPGPGSATTVTSASLPLKDAVPAAVALRDGVVDALATKYPDVTWPGEATMKLAAQDDGRCVLFLNGPSSTDDLFTRSDRMRSLPALLTPVLSAHGYGPASEPKDWSAGGGVDVAADGPGGWRLVVTGKGRNAYLTLTGPVVADQCTADALKNVSTTR